jgi:tellurium resistance protein TerD
VSGLNKGIRKAQVRLKWDPSPTGTPANDLDIVAATSPGDAAHGKPPYLVYFGSRSPDGTIELNRDSRTGQGFGDDEVMTLELDRLATAYTRVVVGVVIQQGEGRKTFGEVANTAVRILEKYTELAAYDFADIPHATAATVGEFFRDDSGVWQFRSRTRGFDADPNSFSRLMDG